MLRSVKSVKSVKSACRSFLGLLWGPPLGASSGVLLGGVFLGLLALARKNIKTKKLEKNWKNMEKQSGKNLEKRNV